jgi:hypothetical protein
VKGIALRFPHKLASSKSRASDAVVEAWSFRHCRCGAAWRYSMVDHRGA